MSLTLGRQGGIAQPLKKRTVGQTNIAHVYDGANHIWPTSVIHFSDFTSVQLRYIWGSDDGRDLDTKSYYVNSPINGLNYVAVGWSQQNQRFEDRERLNSELFGVYIDGRNRTDALIEKNNTDHFNLYKYCKTVKGNYLRIVPFFIYLNFSMDKFIDVIVDGILSNFDFGFMFIVNILTYIIIKVIDYFNGDNKVPTWQKRCVLVISIFTMAMIYIASGYDNTIMLVNSAVLAPVFWSWVVSPILKKLGVGYKDIDNTIG